MFFVSFSLFWHKKVHFNPNWHEGLSPFTFWIGFCQLKFCLNFPNFLEVKIDINRVNLTQHAKLLRQEIPLGGAKDEHFSCFHSSCE